MASGDHSPCRDLQAAVHTPGGQRSNCGGRGQDRQSQTIQEFVTS